MNDNESVKTSLRVATNRKSKYFLWSAGVAGIIFPFIGFLFLVITGLKKWPSHENSKFIHAAIKLGCGLGWFAYCTFVISRMAVDIEKRNISSTYESIEQARPEIAESCLFISQALGPRSSLTSAQKNELWRSYDRRPFRWKTSLIDVRENILNEYTALFQCSDSETDPKLEIYFSKENKSLALSLSRGSYYKIEGKLISRSDSSIVSEAKSVQKLE